MKGQFITFEGIDGAGKSSHIAAVSQWLVQQGRQVIVTREPGGTALAETLRELVLHQAMDPMTEALLVFAARRDHLQQRILPALEQGCDVLCDRFTDATFAYQGGGRGFDPAVLETLEAWVQQGVQPDVTVWFDLPAEVAAHRRQAARVPDRFEAQDTAFFARVRQGYLERSHAHAQRFIVIDALGTREEVWERLMQALTERLA